MCFPLLHWHAREGVAMPVRVCSWEQTAMSVTAVPPASPGQAGVATPVTEQPTGWLLPCEVLASPDLGEGVDARGLYSVHRAWPEPEPRERES